MTATRAEQHRRTSDRRNPHRPIPIWLVLLLTFAAVLAAHAPLLHLPYYWDEAGYYVPAAYDFFRTGSLIPFSTLSNAHPPLPSLYLALWWKLFHFAPVVTRIAMCCIAALALTAVWRIAVVATGKSSVAAATVLLTVLYPVFFAQSSLAQADLFAAAGTLWALSFLLEDRIWPASFCFILAALSKETAIVTPVALAAWESWQLRARPRRIPIIAALLLPVLPLAAWYAYHWSRTGYIFGNPQFLHYNAVSTLSLHRILLAFSYRMMHITVHMNLFVPVALMLGCLLLPPVPEPQESASAAPPRLRQAIAPAHQAIFYVTIAVNVALFSILGGAVLTRYLLPLYPLILLLAVNTFRRRLREWTALVALSAAAFIAGLFINPPYRFAPEDNLEYVATIRLQQAAIQQIVAHFPHATVLTAWPATDELRKPELGYVAHPIPVVEIDDFSAPQILRAAQLPATWTAALIFSTKYDPSTLPFRLGRTGERLDKRYFDFHHDLAPAVIARLLGGTVVWQQSRKGEWAAVLTFDRTPATHAPATGRITPLGTMQPGFSEFAPPPESYSSSASSPARRTACPPAPDSQSSSCAGDTSQTRTARAARRPAPANRRQRETPPAARPAGHSRMQGC
jgi:4-amino-4-deoxy-L-arabinose transferase-like glycosyltransferase